MLKKMAKIISLTVVMSILFTGLTFADVGSASPNLTLETKKVDYTFEEYVQILPFKLTPVDEERAKKVFNDIRNAFIANNLELAGQKTQEFYTIVNKYWMNEQLRDTILPFNKIMGNIKDLLNDQQKADLRTTYNRIEQLRKEKKMKEYFEAISKMYKTIYQYLGEAFGDVYGEMSLLRLPVFDGRGGKSISLDKVINYTFEDYMKIQPFNVNKQDMEKLYVLFQQIKKDMSENKESKENIQKFYSIIQKYWLLESTRKVILPHEDFKNNSFKSFNNAQKLELINVFKAAENARKAKNVKQYFQFINQYYNKLGTFTQEQYGDIFDELVLLAF